MVKCKLKSSLYLTYCRQWLCVGRYGESCCSFAIVTVLDMSASVLFKHITLVIFFLRIRNLHTHRSIIVRCQAQLPCVAPIVKDTLKAQCRILCKCRLQNRLLLLADTRLVLVDNMLLSAKHTVVTGHFTCDYPHSVCLL